MHVYVCTNKETKVIVITTNVLAKPQVSVVDTVCFQTNFLLASLVLYFTAFCQSANLMDPLVDLHGVNSSTIGTVIPNRVVG